MLETLFNEYFYVKLIIDVTEAMDNRMLDEFDTQSWKDRCDRYFTSISDTGKDHEQEKHQRKHIADSSRAQEEHMGNDAPEGQDYDDVLENLSEVNKRFSEHWFIRKIRFVFSVLDVHGSRILSKSIGTSGVVVCFILLLICLSAFGVALGFLVRDFINRPSYFRVVNVVTSRSENKNVEVSVCNLNRYKKSKVLTSQFSDLKMFVKGIHDMHDTKDDKTVLSVLNKNNKLMSFLKEKSDDTIGQLISRLEKDTVLREIMKNSNTSLLYRLSLYGNRDFLHNIIAIPVTDSEEMGHSKDEMLLKCWIDNTECYNSDILTKMDTVLGRCFTVTVTGQADSIKMLLNANTSEYIEELSPEAGFAVTVHETKDLHGLQNAVQVPTGFHSTLAIEKSTSIERLGRGCSRTESKQVCEDRCFRGYVVSKCDCTLASGNDKVRKCKLDSTEDYICIQALKTLQFQKAFSCQCPEVCSENIYSLQATQSPWPSNQAMMKYGDILFDDKKNISDSFFRDNTAYLTVRLTPKIFEKVNEEYPYTILDILVRLGGLSAVVVGLSLTTLLEILYLLVQFIIHAIRSLRKRSESIASLRRLSDSEITSITWAMYRQKRRYEEMMKAKAKEAERADNAGFNIARGNVQNRLSKRDSNLEREKRNNDTEDHYLGQGRKEHGIHNGYLRRYEGRNSGYNQPRTRDSYAKAVRKHSDREKRGSDVNKYNNGDHSASKIRTPAHIDNREAYRNTPEKYNRNHLKSDGVYYVCNDNDNVYTNASDNVMLYNGSGAYFGPSQISEPVYL